MSPTFRYVNGPVKSTVVTLRDGRVMELRRGDMTWTSAAVAAAAAAAAAGELRTFWPSLDAWVSQLPSEWPSVECWRPKAPEPGPVCNIATKACRLIENCGSSVPLALRAKVLRPVQSLLAYFLNTAAATGSDIENALLSYCSFHRLQDSSGDGVRIDDFLALLSGLAPGSDSVPFTEIVVAVFHKT